MKLDELEAKYNAIYEIAHFIVLRMLIVISANCVNYWFLRTASTYAHQREEESDGEAV